LRQRGLVRHIERAPWIPNEFAWASILDASRAESLRNRLMVAMAYDGALRREELVQVEIDDLDLAYSLIHLQAETTKSKRAREVAFGAATGQLLVSYLRDRGRVFGRVNGRPFLSTSRRNRGAPIGHWSWSKVVEGIAERAGLPRFSTHTFRHMRLTDLARADWTVDQIAQYAGHRDLSTTMLYVHLSGRELAAKFQRNMAAIHLERERLLATLVQS
jgi:integrase/recombinase XerD